MPNNQSLYQQFMDNDSHVGPGPEPAEDFRNRLFTEFWDSTDRAMEANKCRLDRVYENRLMEMLSDAAQECVVGNHISISSYKRGLPRLVRRIMSETFAEPISPEELR